MAKCTEKEMSYRDAVTALADAHERLAAANAEIERLRAREEPGRWFVTNRDQNDICIRGPYKYAETARRVREEMELYGRYAKRNTNLGVFNMPEEDHPHA
jgi:hypothetical protein